MDFLKPAKFRRKHQAQAAAQSVASPAGVVPELKGLGNSAYLAARAEWNERYGGYVYAARFWRYVAFLAMGVALIAVSGVVYIGSENHIVPYVVEVDQLGDALTAERADVAATPDTRLIRAQLARWVSDNRSVYLDAAAETHNIQEAYGMTERQSPAYGELTDFFNAHNPFTEAQTQTVSVEITSVLPISANTWQVEWNENTRKRDGSMISDQHWRANITEMVSPPTDEKSVLINPTGLYVQDFSWAAVQ